ncbi:MAG: tRNA preQ1(34) S-adenosylmethionine ribosyltransferase-isomerase QueA [Treponema sp.]|nr:tRNA preQ1(34) S-adenosylmethionine ribosyltransferase-isomerase QueA [Treponema sp.]
MKTSDFDFELPQNLIAQYPPAERGNSRLMVLDRRTGSRERRMVSDLPSLLEKGTLLVFNNSKVRKARLLGNADNTDAKAEFLLLKKLDNNSWKVLAKRSKRKKPGSCFTFEDGTRAELAFGGTEGQAVLRFDRAIDDKWLDRFGHIPLPPYIKRPDTGNDTERYQCVYASRTGSAAAPTAGLHFTGKLMEEFKEAGMETVFITLHVGLGTFLPVRTENIEDHVMHEEACHIGEKEAAAIEKAKKEKRKILAVGTTSLRTLESAWTEGGTLRRGDGLTSIFLYPGARFKVVDMLFTNFHTPKSTLLMLVSAFAGAFSLSGNAGEIPGRGLILETYREAIKENFRFFSYGDAMLIR